MNKVVKTMLITLAVNIGGGALFFIPDFLVKDESIVGMLWIFFVGLIQFIVAILMALGSDQNKQTGIGMLLALGVILVTGMAVITVVGILS